MNTFAILFLQYSFWTSEKLKQLDRKTREVINKNSGQNRKSSFPMTYLSYDQGGYNLSKLEKTYRLSKIKTALQIATLTDQRIQLVREFQGWKEHRGFILTNKVAQRYANELGLEMEFSDRPTGTVMHTTGSQPNTYAVKSDKPSSLNIALRPCQLRKHVTRKKLRNKLGLDSSEISVDLQKMEELPRYCVLYK